MNTRILALIPLLLAGPAFDAYADVYVQNDRKYTGDDGSLHVVGEVVNDLDVPLGQVTVSVSLFDRAGEHLATEETRSLMNTVMPGMKGPFDLIVPDPTAKDVWSYALSLDYDATLPKSQVIDIVDSQLSRDGQDNLMITGTVANRGETTANMITVVATLYDDNGDVAAISTAHPAPDYLKAEDDIFFVMSVPDKDHTMDVDKYALVAESEEFAAVPEFPVGTVVMLASALAAYVVMARYAARITAGPQLAASQTQARLQPKGPSHPEG